MNLYSAEDPCPKIDLKRIPYEAQKAHARELDHQLGFEIESVESQLEREVADHAQIREQWIGLPIQSLLTPYLEIRAVLELLIEQALPSGPESLAPPTPWRVLDVGAGYGRMGWVIHRYLPALDYLGVEISLPRVQEAQRVYSKMGIDPQQLVCADILELDPLPPFDIAFVYDFSTPRAIQQLLEKFKAQAKKNRAESRPFIVVGRGRSTRDQIEREHPWLSQVHEPWTLGHCGIYRA